MNTVEKETCTSLAKQITGTGVILAGAVVQGDVEAVRSLCIDITGLVFRLEGTVAHYPWQAPVANTLKCRHCGDEQPRPDVRPDDDVRNAPCTSCGRAEAREHVYRP